MVSHRRKYNQGIDSCERLPRESAVVSDQPHQIINFPPVHQPDLNRQMFPLMLQLCITLVPCSPRQLHGTDVTWSGEVYL